MAWRPTKHFLEGVLDNSTLGKVTGRMRFAGMKEKVTFDLKGDFHRDIRGAKIRFTGDGKEDDPKAASYMEGFATHQTGRVGDITAGLPPVDYVSYPYVEIYSNENGRVVIELEPEQMEVIGTPIPACESDPISREQQDRNMAEFLCGLARESAIPEEHAICLSGNAVITGSKRAANNRIRGMKLLTQQIRKQLPPLSSQDGKGGEAVVYTKFFSPGSSWTWYCLEGEPIKDEQGREVDFHFFGLVDGHFKELGYFSLSELEGVRGPMGLPIERDLYWKPMALKEIAPDLFKEKKEGTQ